MKTLRRDQRGQTLVLSVVFLTVIMGMGAMSLDVGSWYRAKRAAQVAADAAALAGAQALPENPAQAASLALEYAAKNYHSEDVSVLLLGHQVPNDTVSVRVEAPAPGFFSRLFGIHSVRVGAEAAARAGDPGEARYVAPIVVDEEHPALTCGPDPCFGTPTELEYRHLKEDGSSDGAGSFGFINLIPGGSNPGTSELGTWITEGFDGYMALGAYTARTGNPFGATHVRSSLEQRVGSELLFPMYRSLIGTGSGAKYEIVGWVGFYLTGFDLHGNKEKLFGHFTQVVWNGIEAVGGSDSSPGVKVITLVQ
jgi:hypothetical protein